MQTAVVRLALEIGLPQALVEAKTTTVSELALKTGASQSLIGTVVSCYKQLKQAFIYRCEVKS